jgi:hypothetical protein
MSIENVTSPTCLKAPVHFPAYLLFKLRQAFVTEKNHAGVAVILQGQIAAERPKLPAFDAVKISLGNEIGTDDLLPNIPGVNDRV